MPLFLLMVNKLVFVLVLLSIPVNLYLLVARGNLSSVIGLIASAIALYCVAKVFELNDVTPVETT